MDNKHLLTTITSGITGLLPGTSLCKATFRGRTKAQLAVQYGIALSSGQLPISIFDAIMYIILILAESESDVQQKQKGETAVMLPTAQNCACQHCWTSACSGGQPQRCPSQSQFLPDSLPLSRCPLNCPHLSHSAPRCCYRPSPQIQLASPASGNTGASWTALQAQLRLHHCHHRLKQPSSSCRQLPAVKVQSDWSLCLN